MKKVLHKLFFDSISQAYGCFYSIKKEIACEETPFQKVEIFELEYFGKSLVLDGKIQSTEKDEYIYHEALVHPAMLSVPNPRTVLVIGGGEGATLREVLKHKTVEKAVMVDIDRRVVELCKKHLHVMHQGSFDDPRVRLIFEDARKFIESTDDKFDVVIMDSTDPLQEGPAYLLFTVEFYNMVKERLNPGGAVVVQSNSAALIETDCFTSLNRTLREVFKNVEGYSTYIPSFGLEWGFNLATDGSPVSKLSSDVLNRRFENIEGELRFLDELTLNRLFALPKDTREILAREKRIIRDSQPLYVI